MASVKMVPPGLKAIQPYLKIAEEHEKRDSSITYWCRFYAVQAGLKIDSKSPENRSFLINLMDWLEKEKKAKHDDEAITNDVVAQAHIENYALKLFLWADNEDRSGRFNKNVVKAFYTAGFIYDVVNTFGEPSEEVFYSYLICKLYILLAGADHSGLNFDLNFFFPKRNKWLKVVHHRKYAKWKATYIHNCLKNGTTPIAGPLAMEGDESADQNGEYGNNIPPQPSNVLPQQFPQDLNGSQPQSPYPVGGLFSMPGSQQGYPGQSEGLNLPIPGTHAPPSTPNGLNQLSPSTSVANMYPQSEKSGDVSLTPQDYQKAQKYCKWAGSALQYEDVPTAIENLQKALRLLTTGQDE